MLTLEQLVGLYQKDPGAFDAQVAEFQIGDRFFEFNKRSAIMGVINLSPDSWYRESVCLSVESAVRRASVMISQGADFVDVGAESTVLTAARADEALQTSKLIPVVRALRAAGVLVSVETYQPQVARACLESGANVLNITGTEHNTELYQIAAEHDAAIIICYVQGKNVREVCNFDFGTDTVELMREHFAREIELAQRCGVRKIILDPGLGFYYRNLQDSALRVRYQMNIFLNTFRLRTLGYPICNALPHAFQYFGEQVRCAEPYFAVLAALGRTDLFRTHEVPRVKAVLDTMGAF